MVKTRKNKRIPPKPAGLKFNDELWLRYAETGDLEGLRRLRLLRRRLVDVMKNDIQEKNAGRAEGG